MRLIHAYPMHGYHKMLTEGFRTRDAHIIESAALFREVSVLVHSRPEPILVRRSVAKRAGVLSTDAPSNIRTDSPHSWQLPIPTARRRWWVQTKNGYGVPSDITEPVIVWNPILGISNAFAGIANNKRKLHLDLLDNWLEHQAFASIEGAVTEGYRRLFQEATSISANAEGTLELARSFGRDDCKVILNGCDPTRFDSISKASGKTTIGYVGKIGFRVDLQGVLATVRGRPECNFVFAGPILDAAYRRPLATEPNITLLGDIHYNHVPQLLQTFDIGWVPHGVGAGMEVGGDVIKIYEYRAAGLPVITTAISGAGERGLAEVHVAPIENHASQIQSLVNCGPRVERRSEVIPKQMTWKFKSEQILNELLS